jgi:hypothetical protein
VADYVFGGDEIFEGERELVKMRIMERKRSCPSAR